MIRLIKDLFQAFRPIVEAVWNELFPSIKPAQPVKKIPVKLSGKIIDFPKNLRAHDAAINYLESSKMAFMAGFHRWEGGDQYGVRFNNILRCEYKGLFYLVKRQFDGGILSEVEAIKIPELEYNKIKKSRKYKFDTYCNFAASIFFNSHSYGIIHDNFKKTLQYFDKERSANSICKALKTGIYSQGNIIYKGVDLTTARQISKSGGLVFATWKRIGRRGHIATLTGNLIKGSGEFEIYQAGAKFGRMPISAGFGLKDIKPIKFYARIYK